jgi:hypothetical protein
MSRKYAVIFERAETNWAAYVPDLPSCITTGKTWRKRSGMSGKQYRAISRRSASLVNPFPSLPVL